MRSCHAPEAGHSTCPSTAHRCATVPRPSGACTNDLDLRQTCIWTVLRSRTSASGGGSRRTVHFDADGETPVRMQRRLARHSAGGTLQAPDSSVGVFIHSANDGRPPSTGFDRRALQSAPSLDKRVQTGSAPAALPIRRSSVASQCHLVARSAAEPPRPPPTAPRAARVSRRSRDAVLWTLRRETPSKRRSRLSSLRMIDLESHDACLQFSQLDVGAASQAAVDGSRLLPSRSSTKAP